MGSKNNFFPTMFFATFVICLIIFIACIIPSGRKVDRQMIASINRVCPGTEITLKNISKFKEYMEKSGNLPQTPAEYQKRCAEFEKEILDNDVKFLNETIKKGK